MRQAHAGFCADHQEGICQANDVAAGKWEIGLVDDGTGPTIYLFHPENLPAVERGAMNPAEAIELGRALLTQGMRGSEATEAKASGKEQRRR